MGQVGWNHTSTKSMKAIYGGKLYVVLDLNMKNINEKDKANALGYKKDNFFHVLSFLFYFWFWNYD